jgi:[CysO sulfur-carrier protein]-S-L-cysteine hydrolase
MTEVKLARTILSEIISRAERDFPEETCGFVIGGGEAQEIRPITNIQNAKHTADPKKFPRDARTAFLMDPKEHLAVLNEVDSRRLQLLAIYHSHPDHDAYFSATDRANACSFDPLEPDYPETFHVVLSVLRGKFVRLAAFVWDPVLKDFVERELRMV